jgi:hypothetical protein
MDFMLELFSQGTKEIELPLPLSNNHYYLDIRLHMINNIDKMWTLYHHVSEMKIDVTSFLQI